MSAFRGVKKFQLVEVTWRDSATELVSWHSEDEAEAWLEDELITTAGYFFTVKEKNALLVMSRCKGEEGGDVGGLWSIPLACVVKVRRLR